MDEASRGRDRRDVRVHNNAGRGRGRANEAGLAVDAASQEVWTEGNTWQHGTASLYVPGGMRDDRMAAYGCMAGGHGSTWLYGGEHGSTWPCG